MGVRYRKSQWIADGITNKKVKGNLLMTYLLMTEIMSGTYISFPITFFDCKLSFPLNYLHLHLVLGFFCVVIDSNENFAAGEPFERFRIVFVLLYVVNTP